MKVAVIYGVIGALALSVGCNATPSGNAQLGINDFEVTQTANGVHVIAVDDQAQAIGELDIANGHVSLPIVDLDGEGVTMHVRFADQQNDHQHIGSQAVTLPPTGDEKTDAFLADAHVKPVLAAYGITIAPLEGPQAAPNNGDVPKTACTFSFNGACGETDCAQEITGGVTYEGVCCGTSKLAVKRSCSTPNGTSACGQNGPGGCAVCWSTAYTALCAADECSSTQVYMTYRPGGIGTPFANISFGNCTPHCGSTCGQNDGCGGTCNGTCAGGHTCTSSNGTCGQQYTCGPQ